MNYTPLRFVFALAILLHHVTAQASSSFPLALWTATIPPVEQGNECALSTLNDALLVCTGRNGTVTALIPKIGVSSSPIWSYSPTSLGMMSSASGVTFSRSGFLVYSTIDMTATDNVCRIHSISVSDGKPVWVSKALLGACSGTPVISFDEKYVFVTHNRMTNGTFTILDASNGVVFFQSADAQQLLSPPAIFFAPSQGNFQGGEGNTNDLVVYANRPSLKDEEVPIGSATYAFQFPIGFSGSKVGLNVTTLLNNSDFQTFTPPLITDQGNSMFWGVSRSKVNGWIGIGFDRDVGGNNIGYDRGDPPFLPILSEITLGKKLVSPNLYTGTAGNAFAAISAVGDSMTPLWNVSTSSPIYAKSQVTTHNGSEAVFFIEELGKAYLLDGNTGKQIWSFMASEAKVLGNFAMNSQGTIVYFSDTNGKLNAWQIVDTVATNNLTTTIAPSSSSGNSGPSKTPISSLPTAGTPVASTPTALQAPVASTPTVGTSGEPVVTSPTAGSGPYALNPTAGSGPYALNPTAGEAPYSLNSTEGGPVTNNPTAGAPSGQEPTATSAVPVVTDSSLNPGAIASPAPIPTASVATPIAKTPTADTFSPESAPTLLGPGSPAATQPPTVSALTDKPSSKSSGYKIKFHVLTLCSYTLFLLL